MLQILISSNIKHNDEIISEHKNQQTNNENSVKFIFISLNLL
jgi:hypothetical protein